MLAVFSILSKIVPKLKFNGEKIKEELEEGFACATEFADLLAKKGVPFRKAHEISGGVVKDCIAKKKHLSSLSAAEVSVLAGVPVSQKELSEAVSVDKVARFASAYKFPAKSAYADSLAQRKKSLESAHALLLKEVKSITG